MNWKKYAIRNNPQYTSDILRFSLILRYTSIQSDHLMQNEFKLPSLSVFSKLKSGEIDNTKALIALKSKGSISEDVIILFYDMFL